MSFFVDIVSEDSFYENLTLGVTKVLENTPCVKNVQLERRQPCDRASLSTWEQRHCCTLSEDLRNFYMSTDGFLLTWILDLAGEEFPTGRMEITDLNNLKRFHPAKDQPGQQQQPARQSSPAASTSEPSKPEEPAKPTPDAASQPSDKPNFTHPRCKLFELSSFQECKAILAYHIFPTDRDNGSIWLYRPGATAAAAQWHRLADDFTRYFRMMLAHLGLPQWQLPAAGLPVPSRLHQIYNLVGPHLLAPVTTSSNSSSSSTTVTNVPLRCNTSSISTSLWIDGPTNLIDPAIFRSKDSGKQQLQKSGQTKSCCPESKQKSSGSGCSKAS